MVAATKEKKKKVVRGFINSAHTTFGKRMRRKVYKPDSVHHEISVITYSTSDSIDISSISSAIAMIPVAMVKEKARIQTFQPVQFSGIEIHAIELPIIEDRV